MQLPPGLTLGSVDKELAERKLGEFTRQSWRYCDPAVYQHNWHIDCIGEHCEAIARRQIKRGIIFNVPPRHMKSISVNVMLPAWCWAQDPDPDKSGHGRNIRPDSWLGPGVRFLSASYALRLAARDNVKCRRIILSPWYQKNWPGRVTFAKDQNTKTYYENEQGGARFATGVDAQVTGEGGDIIIVDDALNVKEANSPTVRTSMLEWWAESMQTRLNDPVHGVFIIVEQRTNEFDLTGYIRSKEISRELGFEHVVLPARFEKSHPFRTISSIGYNDPRTKEGELLWPERFTEDAYGRLAGSMSEYAIAGQLQQRPSPREGGLFKRSWFTIVDAAPATRKRVRRWDLAASIPKPGTDPDYTVGLKLSLDDAGVFYVEHVVRFRDDPGEVERRLLNTASQDGRGVKVVISQDPGQAGKSQVHYYVTKLRGYNAGGARETGDKTLRADPVAAQAKIGNVKIVRDKEGDRWNDKFLDELMMFGSGVHDDQVDALSGAFDDLVNGAAQMREVPIGGGY